MKPVRLALCVNPMSGRDVRRLAARASNMTHEAKRDMVARVAAGAEAVGVTDLYISREPFRIATLALQHMGLDLRVHVSKPRSVMMPGTPNGRCTRSSRPVARPLSRSAVTAPTGRWSGPMRTCN